MKAPSATILVRCGRLLNTRRAKGLRPNLRTASSGPPRFVLRVLVTVKMLVAISVACLVAQPRLILPSPWSPPPGPRADRREELHGSRRYQRGELFHVEAFQQAEQRVGACAYVQLASRISLRLSEEP